MYSMRIAVISGGGSDGAVTVGRLSVLTPSYEKAYGISTGALIVPLCLLKEWKRLELSFTDVKQSDITEKTIFNKKGRPNLFKTTYHFFRANLLGKATIGESNNLKKKIDKEFLKEDFNNLVGKKGYVGAFNLSYEKLEYFCSSNTDFEAFKTIMWASSCPPIIFSLVKFLQNEYCDGGLQSVVPIVRAVQDANFGDEIDVFMHEVRPNTEKKKSIANILHYILRTAKIYRKMSTKKDMQYGIDLAKAKGIKLNIYWQAYEVESNSLIFNKEKMKERFELGKIWALDESLIDRY